MSYTVKCVRCLKPATIWGGHVIGGKNNPIAGWCSERCLDARGFSGRWQTAMGETSQLRSIKKKRERLMAGGGA